MQKQKAKLGIIISPITTMVDVGLDDVRLDDMICDLFDDHTDRRDGASPCVMLPPREWGDAATREPVVGRGGITRAYLAYLRPMTVAHVQVAACFETLGATVHHIRRVENNPRYNAFVRNRMDRMCGDHPINPATDAVVMYHGFTSDDLEATTRSFALNGPKIGLSTGGHFGRAFYVSESPVKAHRYTSRTGGSEEMHRKSKTRYMLRCLVDVGNVYTFPPGIGNPSLVEPPEGYDSVCGFMDRADEYAIYDGSQVLVTEVIVYQVK